MSRGSRRIATSVRLERSGRDACCCAPTRNRCFRPVTADRRTERVAAAGTETPDLKQASKHE